jgi:hypothetical protein
MKELSLAIVCVLTMAAWTPAQQPPPDCPDLVRALQDMMRAVMAPLAGAAVQRALQGPAR